MSRVLRQTEMPPLMSRMRTASKRHLHITSIQKHKFFTKVLPFLSVLFTEKNLAGREERIVKNSETIFRLDQGPDPHTKASIGGDSLWDSERFWRFDSMPPPSISSGLSLLHSLSGPRGSNCGPILTLRATPGQPRVPSLFMYQEPFGFFQKTHLSIFLPYAST